MSQNDRVVEKRTLEYRALDLEAPEGGSNRLVGYASLFEAPYEVYDKWGSYMELVKRGAFTKTLQESKSVILRFDHTGVPLANTASGTLSLRADETGLWVEAELEPKSPVAAGVLSAVRRGDANRMSIAIRILKDGWDANFENREIQEARLFDVSVVGIPASPDTSVSIRNLNIDELTDEEATLLLGRLTARSKVENADTLDLGGVTQDQLKRKLELLHYKLRS